MRIKAVNAGKEAGTCPEGPCRWETLTQPAGHSFSSSRDRERMDEGLAVDGKDFYLGPPRALSRQTLGFETSDLEMSLFPFLSLPQPYRG